MSKTVLASSFTELFNPKPDFASFIAIFSDITVAFLITFVAGQLLLWVCVLIAHIRTKRKPK